MDMDQQEEQNRMDRTTGQQTLGTRRDMCVHNRCPAETRCPRALVTLKASIVAHKSAEWWIQNFGTLVRKGDGERVMALGAEVGREGMKRTAQGESLYPCGGMRPSVRYIPPLSITGVEPVLGGHWEHE